MKWLFIIILALALCGCRSTELEQIAQSRVAELEACQCTDHRQLDEINPYWAEVAASSNQPLSLQQLMDYWFASPAHKEALLSGDWKYYGFAQSDTPVNGWWYSVLIVEE